MSRYIPAFPELSAQFSVPRMRGRVFYKRQSVLWWGAISDDAYVYIVMYYSYSGVSYKA